MSETPKNADVICEQPLIRALWNFVKVSIQLYCTLSLLSSVQEIGDWGRQIISLHRCVALALGSNGEQIEALSTNVMMTLLRNMAIGFVYYCFVRHITFTKCCTLHCHRCHHLTPSLVVPLVLLLLPPGQPSIQTNFLLRHPAQELKKCTDKIYRLSLPTNSLQGRTSQEEMRGTH